MLQLFGLFKQSTDGDVNVPRPEGDAIGAAKWCVFRCDINGWDFRYPF